jgi:hypothetical protein
VIFAERALLPGGWAERVRVAVAAGRIDTVTTGAAAEPGDTSVSALLPALSNLHSHAFQRAMAGMTEHRVAGRDSFWTWRDLMYRFLDHLSPGQMQAIAALVYMEMQEAGYAAVGEFHYVHHQQGGAAMMSMDFRACWRQRATVRNRCPMTRASASPRIPCAPPIPPTSPASCRWRRDTRSTSISPNSQRRSPTFPPGSAPGRWNGCWPMPRSALTGARSMRPI